MTDKELDDLEAWAREHHEKIFANAKAQGFAEPDLSLAKMADAIAELRKKNAGLAGAIQEALEYFDDRMDADQPSGSAPIPNDEMRLFMMLESAITRGH